MSYGKRKINVVGDRFWKKDASFLLNFGEYSSTYILAYGHLDDALESCGEWLLENAPGLIIPHGSCEEMELYVDACADLGVDFHSDWINDEDVAEKVRESAEADLTYTESGWITSHEWGIVKENPTKEFLVEFHRNET